MKQAILFGIILALVGALMGAIYWKAEQAGVPQWKNGKPVVKIGAALPLSGNMADVGYAAYKAFAKAIEDANSNPANKLYYEFLAEDNQMIPLRTKTIADKFVYVDKVNVLIGEFTMPAMVLAQIAAQHKIINFNISFSGAPLQSKYNFQNLITNESEAEALTAFLISKNVKSVSLLFVNVGAGDEVLEKLLPKLKEKNINAKIERFNTGERHFSILATKIKNADTQAVIIMAYQPEVDIIIREFRQQKVNKIVNLPFMTKNLSLYEGMYGTVSAPLSPEMRKHIGLEGKNTTFGAYFYDTANIIVGAFEKAYDGKTIPTADEVSDVLLSQRNYSGLVGDYVLDERGQFHSRAETAVVKNGEFVRVE